MKKPSLRSVLKSPLTIAFAAFIAALLSVTIAFAEPEGENENAAPPPTAAATAPGSPKITAGHNEAKVHGENAEGSDANEHEDHAEHGPEAINWTDLSDKSRPAIIGLLINFGILAAIYYALGKKPLVDGLKQRRVTIGKDIEEAREMLAEAKERAKKYQADLKNADTDAATAKTSLVSAGKGEVEHLIAETQERADRMARDAERLVNQERKQLEQDLLVETIGLAVEHAHKLLERGVTPEDHARLANELLAELGRKPAAARRAPQSVRPAPTSGGGAA